MSTEIFEAIKKVVERLTGVQAFSANQNDISPRGAYATILVMQSAVATSRGTVKQKIINDGNDAVVTARYPVTWTVTINFWRGKAIENATRLMNIFYLPATSDELLASGVGLVNCSNVQNLTALQSKSFEERAVITLTLTTFEEISEQVGVIRKFGISVENEDGKELAKYPTEETV